MAQYGATLASPVLRTILSFHTNFDTEHVSDEDVRVVAHAMVGFMIGNVGFGPLATYFLHLKDLFDFTPGLVFNAENVAGIFETVLGALISCDEQGLLVVVTNWAFLCIFVVAWLQRRR